MNTILNRTNNNKFLRNFEDINNNSISSTMSNTSTTTNTNNNNNNINNGISVYNITQSKQRKRTQFTQEQLNNLEELFQENHYPNSEDKKRLSYKINIEESKIHVWFQNRRSRENKIRRFTNKRVKIAAHGMKITSSLAGLNNEAVAAFTTYDTDKYHERVQMKKEHLDSNDVSSMSSSFNVSQIFKKTIENNNSIPPTLNKFTKPNNRGLMYGEPCNISNNMWRNEYPNKMSHIPTNYIVNNKTTVQVTIPSSYSMIDIAGLNSPYTTTVKRTIAPLTNFSFVGSNNLANATADEATNSLLLSNFAYANYMIGNHMDGSVVNHHSLNYFDYLGNGKLHLKNVDTCHTNNLITNNNVKPKITTTSLIIPPPSTSSSQVLNQGYYDDSIYIPTSKESSHCDEDSGISFPSTNSTFISSCIPPGSTLKTMSNLNDNEIALRPHTHTTNSWLPETTDGGEQLFDLLPDDILHSPFSMTNEEPCASSSYFNHSQPVQRSRLGSLSFLDDIFLSEEYCNFDGDGLKTSCTNTGSSFTTDSMEVHDYMDEMSPLFTLDSLRGYHSEDFDAEF